ncbi:LytTR family DNA-binding domain-containing protein [Marinilabilia sp.]|uniref:LytTR family DNA-binding domain-containing protein n=1 Tax=Marinilabilia sp. TaxID=2021252 RepID=UPI0025C2A445|nr:LytTR family DNA-binding domain-containing protein [Marinilabilia sp.]
MFRFKYFDRPYTQNYIFRYPLRGAFVLFLFLLLFTILYRPLNTHEALSIGFEITMLVYSLGATLAAWGTIVLLKRTEWFGLTTQWTMSREFLFILIVVSSMGIAVYLMAFGVEESGEVSRWNVPTFWDSFHRTALVALVPFLYFTSFHLKELFRKSDFVSENSEEGENAIRTKIHISSKLKKESLQFFEDEFLFATSEGNYVVFHLWQEGKTKRVAIRNSISDIDKQLESVPAYFRCHRAFIVNTRQIKEKRGNSLGYRLELFDCVDQIPVSRQNIKKLDSLLAYVD